MQNNDRRIARAGWGFAVADVVELEDHHLLQQQGCSS